MNLRSSEQHNHQLASPISNLGWSDLLRGVNGIRSLTLAGGVALHATNTYISTTMLPTVVDEIGGLNLYAWNTTLFVIASILGSVFSSRLIDWLGPRGSYIAAAAIFLCGSIVCSTASNMPFMLFGRFVQGLGGGLLFAFAYSMSRVIFPESLWSRAMALVSGMWGVATLAGPAIGGLFVEFGSWRAAFWTVSVLAMLFGWLSLLAIPKEHPGRHAKKSSQLPFWQVILLTSGIAVLSVVSASPNLLFNLVAAFIACSFISGFIIAERKLSSKLLPSDLFQKNSSLGVIFTLIALFVITVTSGEIFVPLFLQILHDSSPLVSGYMAALIAAGWTIGSLTSAGANPKLIHKLILSGLVMGFLSMLALAFLMPQQSDGLGPVMLSIGAALFAVGVGVGMAWPHLLTEVLKGIPPDEDELAGSSITTVQLTATALSSSLAGIVANAAGLTEPGGVDGTASAALWIYLLFSSAPIIGIAALQRWNR